MDNHTRERMDGFIEIAREIHKAHVLIEDIHCRNMMVFPDHPTRVLWLDFDVSRPYDEGRLTDKQKRLFEEEMGFVIELGEDMVRDLFAPDPRTDSCYPLDMVNKHAMYDYRRPTSQKDVSIDWPYALDWSVQPRHHYWGVL